MFPLQSLSDVKKLPEGTPLYIQNHIRGDLSRLSKIVKRYSSFFTVLAANGTDESWLFTAPEPKAAQVITDQSAQKVDLFSKQGRLLYTLHLNPASFPIIEK